MAISRPGYLRKFTWSFSLVFLLLNQLSMFLENFVASTLIDSVKISLMSPILPQLHQKLEKKLWWPLSHARQIFQRSYATLPTVTDLQLSGMLEETWFYLVHTRQWYLWWREVSIFDCFLSIGMMEDWYEMSRLDWSGFWNGVKWDEVE